MKISKNLTAIIVFTILSLIFVFPIFKNFTNFGVGDWDQHFVYNAAPKITIEKFGQFPLWNPYYCGGNVLLAHPESSFLSPTYLFVIFFGVVAGMKIQILFHLVLGMFGMYLLSKHLKFGAIASFLPSIVYFMSSWFALRMNAGHTLYMSLAFLPYAFLFYLKSVEEKRKYAIISAAFLALMFFSGATYPFIFSLMLIGIHSIFYSMQRKSISPLAFAAVIAIASMLFASVKLFPVYSMVAENPLEREDREPMSFKIFFDSLFSRNQEIESRIFMENKSKWVWHEYGSYIGIFAFILLIASFFIKGLLKKYWAFHASAIIFALFVLGDSGYLWQLLKKLPFFSQLIAPSRFNIIFIFCIAILAGASLSWLENSKIKQRKTAVVFIVLLIAFDMFLVSSRIYSQIFQAKPVEFKNAPEFTQIFLAEKFNNMYPAVEAGFGVTNCYEKLHVPIGVIPALSTEGFAFTNYRGEAYLLRENRSLKFDYFSPNKLIISLQNKIDDTLIINQNFEKGWKSNAGKIHSYNNLIAVDVPKGTEKITLNYLPKSFIFGIFISSISIIVAAVLYFRKL